MTDLQNLARTYFDLELSEKQLATFETYTAQLIEWNQRLNLTRITAPQDITIRHFLDSLSVLSVPGLASQAKLIDIGSGAGLPGLALKIAQPEWHVTLMDSTAKKVAFLQHVITVLGLENTHAISMRAEEAGQSSVHREQYDIVTARAVAHMSVLAEYMLPLCKLGGICIAMKGATAKEETQNALFSIELLGGKVEYIRAVKLPDVEQPHHLVCVRKERATLSKYPRRAGMPAKKPLMPKQKK